VKRKRRLLYTQQTRPLYYSKLYQILLNVGMTHEEAIKLMDGFDKERKEVWRAEEITSLNKEIDKLDRQLTEVLRLAHRHVPRKQMAALTST
jgi:hypothetical protein